MESMKSKKLQITVLTTSVNLSSSYSNKPVDVFKPFPFFLQDGSDQFFVKWLGWGSQFNTWEPLRNLNCHENLNTFMKKLILDILFVKWCVLFLFHCMCYIQTVFVQKNIHIIYVFLFRRPPPSCKTLVVSTYRSIIEQWVRNTPKGLYMKKLNGGFHQKGLAMSTLTKMLHDAVYNKCLKSREQIVETIKDHCALLRMKEVRREQLEILKVLKYSLHCIMYLCLNFIKLFRAPYSDGKTN